MQPYRAISNGKMTKNGRFLPMLMSRFHPKSVVFVLFDGFQSIDFAGPLQVFATANEELDRPDAYQIETLGVSGEHVIMHPGVRVIPDGELGRGDGRDLKRIDTLVVPGGPGIAKLLGNKSFSADLKALADRADRVCSVCTGAFLLADAGLLDNRDATTHWRSCDKLATAFPSVCVKRDPLWIKSDHIWSSAGVTAGIDLALALVEADHGSQLAQMVARRLVMYMRRSGGQAQFSGTLALQGTESFSPLVEWITENLDKPLTVELLAQRSKMSPRTFYRKFVARTGVSPAKAIERLRLDSARGLMETTSLSVEAIASRVGFGNGHRLRRAFARAFGVSPGDWRDHVVPVHS